MKTLSRPFGVILLSLSIFCTLLPAKTFVSQGMGDDAALAKQNALSNLLAIISKQNNFIGRNSPPFLMERLRQNVSFDRPIRRKQGKFYKTVINGYINNRQIEKLATQFLDEISPSIYLPRDYIDTKMSEIQIMIAFIDSTLLEESVKQINDQLSDELSVAKSQLEELKRDDLIQVDIMSVTGIDELYINDINLSQKNASYPLYHLFRCPK